MYHLQPVVTHRLYQSHNLNPDERSRLHTCGVDPDRIHKLVEKCPSAIPPLIDGDTPGSGMERKKFDQVSCLHIQARCIKERYKVARMAQCLLKVKALNAKL